MPSVMPIDVHAHYVPPSALEALQSRARELSLSLVETPSCQKAIHFDNGPKIRPFFPALIEPLPQRLAAMEQQGVDRQVLSVWADIFGYRMPPAIASRWHRFLNEHLARVRDSHPDHFAFLASVPLPHAAQSALELAEAVKELGAIGAIVGANVEEINLGELVLDEFWSAACELDVPIFIHPVQVVPQPRSARFGLSQTVQFPMDTTLCVGSLIFSGVLDRFPKLRLILPHGGGAFPYLLGRFDCMHERMDRAAQGDMARAPPSHYVQRFWYDTLLHHPAALRWLADLVSIDRLVLGSDYSFPPADRDPVGSLRRASFTDDELWRVLEANPRQLFNGLSG
jgi:aminocarboxymuconate-semialdehyde decarboxylase